MPMKVLLAQPATKRFEWELEVLLTNLRQFTDMEVVLLFSEHDFTIPIFFREKYGCSVFTFTDNRDNKMYIPSIRPYLLWQYLRAHPEAEQETYFYIDSDIIFREWLDFATLGFGAGKVVGSSCDSYISYDYLASRTKGPQIAAKMAEICGITVEQMKDVTGIGAHLVLTDPTAAFWERAYRDSNAIYTYLLPLTTDTQKWTAEMWAQLWGWVREGQQIIASPELDFCRPTDDIGVWDTVKIMHNAGVLDDKELFFKGKYVDTSPFGEDLDYVRADKVSSKYVAAIKKVLL